MLIRPYDENHSDKTKIENQENSYWWQKPMVKKFYYEAQHLMIAAGGKSYPAGQMALC